VPTTAELLETLIDQSMPRDLPRLRARLTEIARRPDEDPAWPVLIDDINKSRELRERRAKVATNLNYPDLPVVAAKQQILEAIRDHQVIVLAGETGSGKTTQLPKICLELGRGVTHTIGHTQPRRIAARTVAQRIADELGTTLGQAVGFRVRHTDRSSPESVIRLMTDGILLAETQSDPLLTQYDTIIIDEAHERTLNIDFLLGYLHRILPRRPDLKLIITSATIEPARFAAHFSDDRRTCPVIEVSGRTYPVEVRYKPTVPEEPDTDEDGNPIALVVDPIDAIVTAVAEVLNEDGTGDVLTFHATEREIRETAIALSERFTQNGVADTVEILPLYARLSTEEQQRVFSPKGKRRVVLATNVAETSITVPNIRFVIDPGEARISRYSTRTKVQRLPIETISQASANQRKGRCGRVGPGICVRLYSEADFTSRPEYTDPEILRTNLASVILQMTALNLGNVADFPFLDRPDTRQIRDGYTTLYELGAVTIENRLTPLGKRLARLPTDPRIGRMILAALDEGVLDEVLVIAAALSVQDPRDRPADKAQAADAAHAVFRDEGSDFIGYLKLWETYQAKQRQLGTGKLRAWCRDHFLSYSRLREWQETHRQLRALAADSLIDRRRSRARREGHEGDEAREGRGEHRGRGNRDRAPKSGPPAEGQEPSAEGTAAGSPEAGHEGRGGHEGHEGRDPGKRRRRRGRGRRGQSEGNNIDGGQANADQGAVQRATAGPSTGDPATVSATDHLGAESTAAEAQTMSQQVATVIPEASDLATPAN
jgi:ATP-dependent helicase HrpA